MYRKLFLTLSADIFRLQIDIDNQKNFIKNLANSTIRVRAIEDLRVLEQRLVIAFMDLDVAEMIANTTAGEELQCSGGSPSGVAPIHITP